MEFIVTAQELKKKLEVAKRFTGRSSMEITKSIKLHIPEKHDILIIEASDYSKGCRIRVADIDIKSRGSIVVDGDRLQRIVSSFKDGELHFKAASQLVIKSKQGSVFKLALLNALEFPKIPRISNKEKTFTIEAKVLLDVCERLQFATDPSLTKEGTTRPFAELVYFREGIVFATDSFKLAALKMEDMSTSGMDLPIGALPFLKLLDGEVSITPENTDTYIQNGDFFFFLRVPLTQAPIVEQVIRSFDTPKASYAFEEEDLAQLRINLQRLLILDDEVTLLFKKNKILMGSFSSEGEHVCEVKISSKDFSEEVAGAYNIRFLQSALKKVTRPTIGAFGGKSPVKITEDNYACLVQAIVRNYGLKLKRYDEEGTN